MFSGSQSDIVQSAVPLVPDYVRASGGIHVRLAASAGRTQAIERGESGGYRVRFPRETDCEGVLINTGGGMAGGDRLTVEVALGAGTEAVLTTQAAEKIYRSDGAETKITVRLAFAAGARLAWLPQEHDPVCGARFHAGSMRRFAPNSSLTLVESIVFGRLAMGESVRSGVSSTAGASAAAAGSSSPRTCASTGRTRPSSTARRWATARGRWPPCCMSRPTPKAASTRPAILPTRAANAAPAPGTAAPGALLVASTRRPCAPISSAFSNRFRGAPMPRSGE